MGIIITLAISFLLLVTAIIHELNRAENELNEIERDFQAYKQSKMIGQSKNRQTQSSSTPTTPITAYNGPKITDMYLEEATDLPETFPLITKHQGGGWLLTSPGGVTSPKSSKSKQKRSLSKTQTSSRAGSLKEKSVKV